MKVRSWNLVLLCGCYFSGVFGVLEVYLWFSLCRISIGKNSEGATCLSPERAISLLFGWRRIFISIAIFLDNLPWKKIIDDIIFICMHYSLNNICFYKANYLSKKKSGFPNFNSSIFLIWMCGYILIHLFNPPLFEHWIDIMNS